MTWDRFEDKRCLLNSVFPGALAVVLGGREAVLGLGRVEDLHGGRARRAVVQRRVLALQKGAIVIVTSY